MTAIHSNASIAHVVQYQTWGNDLEATKSFLKDAIINIAIHPRLKFELGVTLKSNKELIVGCGVFIKKES